MSSAKVKRATPTCPECKNRTTQKQLDKYAGKCRQCFIPPYDEARAKALIGKARGVRGVSWDGVVAEMKPLMHPPPGKQWTVVTVIQLDGDRLNW